MEANMDKKPVTKEELLAMIDKHTAENINSWGDLYGSLRSQVLAYFASPNRRSAEFALALLLSFVVALEQNPEEGDAQKIAKAMNILLVMEQDKLGVEVNFTLVSMEEREALRETVSHLLHTLLTPTEEEPASTDTKPKRVLH